MAKFIECLLNNQDVMSVSTKKDDALAHRFEIHDTIAAKSLSNFCAICSLNNPTLIKCTNCEIKFHKECHLESLKAHNKKLPGAATKKFVCLNCLRF